VPYYEKIFLEFDESKVIHQNKKQELLDMEKNLLMKLMLKEN